MVAATKLDATYSMVSDLCDRALGSFLSVQVHIVRGREMVMIRHEIVNVSIKHAQGCVKKKVVMQNMINHIDMNN